MTIFLKGGLFLCDFSLFRLFFFGLFAGFASSGFSASDSAGFLAFGGFWFCWLVAFAGSSRVPMICLNFPTSYYGRN